MSKTRELSFKMRGAKFTRGGCLGPTARSDGWGRNDRGLLDKHMDVHTIEEGYGSCAGK